MNRLVAQMLMSNRVGEERMSWRKSYLTERRRSVSGKNLILIATAVLLCGAVLGAWLGSALAPRHSPQLIVNASVASDFEALALETWEQFLAAFQARVGCFSDVRLRATRTLDNRAGYDPQTATVTVRVPGTRAMLQGALVHEWAHHLEFQCQAHQDLRPAFLSAQGLPLDTPWRPDDTPASAWADIPSEQYAEATIELVLGDRRIPTKVRVTREAIHVVAEWAAGD